MLRMPTLGLDRFIVCLVTFSPFTAADSNAALVENGESGFDRYQSSYRQLSWHSSWPL
jgi:hypothetical protein